MQFTHMIPAAIRGIQARISQRGGRAFLVGGAVIDAAEGRQPKDWDLEVFGLSYAELEQLFTDLQPKTVGKAFGVLKLTMQHEGEPVDIDLNIPRTDNKVGVGHQGFDVVMQPNMTPQEAARRRDFTINAMAVCLVTGELVDPFGGMKDLSEGVLRVTDPVLFREDPLRALRAMQLLARKARTVDPATMTIIRGMVGSFPELPKERVHEEWRKLLLKAPKPSVGLQFLRESGWIVHFPELVALIGCPQRDEWHPEGDVWTHSLLAADAAAQILHLIPEEQREAFAFGVFLHDVGKPKTTITPEMMAARDPRIRELAEANNREPEDLLLTAYGHDEAGMDPAETFMRRMTDSKKLISLVRGIVGLHMQPWSLKVGNAGKGAFARLHRKMVEAGGDLRLIGRVCQCDACATGPNWKTRSLASGSPNWEHETSQRVMDFAVQFDNEPAALQPKVQGRDLLVLGLQPGPQLGALVKKALGLQEADASLTKEDILRQIMPST
jgi:tRNA nucleotidyltransferase (CCA-adding enzyme)